MTRNASRALAVTLAMLFITAATAQTAENEPLIPYQQFTLENGLTLIVHEDPKAPIAAVNIWYHVGSRNERPGQTGYAHLFEHLMFQGSQNSGGEFLELVESAGATDLNGTTWFDRTNYFQTVPVGALDRILFLESDRMGHMLEAVDQAVLDEQRGVVQNEKRQGENQPYSQIWRELLEHVFPPGHPYSWETIGSMEDLEAASLEEMQEWFKTYYGPNNAVLVIAGDVQAEEVLEKVNYWFGDIPAGPPLTVLEEWIPQHATERRQLIQDRVPQDRIYIAWPGPRWGTTEAHQLGLGIDILANGKNSRLYERLVYRDQIATDVSLAGFFLEVSGLLVLEISVKPGIDIAKVEQAAREEINDFLRKGPKQKELQREQTQERAAFLRGIERIGGFGGKSAVLAEDAVYGGDPGLYQQALNDVAAAKTRDVRDVTRRWLDQPPYIAHIVPFPEFSDTGIAADRSALPVPTEPKAATFPPFDSAVLDSGLRLVVVERPTIPVINLSLIVDSGYASDRSDLMGEASMTMAMLDEGAGELTALQISEQLAQLGATLSSGAGLDTASVNLSALTENLDESLDLYARVILQPTFPQFELERLRSQYRTAIQQEKSRPISMALRVLPGLLYGEGHAYAQPLTGSGTEQTIDAITRDDLQNWHDTWFRPNNATMVIVGDTTLDDIKPRIDKLFSDWRRGEVPQKNIATVTRAAGDQVYLIDKPGAEQSIIFASQLVVPMANPDETAIDAFNDILGGQFSARINMNLREEKHWSYGARSTIVATRAQRPFFAYAPVQTDRTADSVAEILREITEIRTTNPPSKAELHRVQRSNTLSLSGRWETNPAVLASIAQIISYGLPEDYWDTYPELLNALTVEQVTAAGQSTIDPADLTWVIIGDRARIEAELRELELGEIQLLDVDGNPVAADD
jgi:zinc protease